MNILVAFNSNYFMPALVMLQSLLVNNRWCRDITVYVLYSDLTEAEIRRYSQLAADSGHAKAVFIDVGKDAFRDAPLHIKRITRETYYRLLAQEKLPLSVERVLYLDVDMIVMGSLEEFYNQDFEGKLLVACSCMKPGASAHRLEQLTLPPDATYFNAGTLLYDMKGQRREIDPNILYEYPVLFYNQLDYGDQDVLNAVFYGMTKFAPFRVYNMFDLFVCRQRDVERVMRHCRIYHFNGKGKPWTKNYWGLMSSLFWTYADQLPEYAGRYDALRQEQAKFKKQRSAKLAAHTKNLRKQQRKESPRHED